MPQKNRPDQTGEQSLPIAEANLTSHAEEINRVLFEIASAVNTTPNLDLLYATIHATLARILDVTNFFIAIVDSRSRTLYFPYHVDTVDEDFSPINDFDASNSLTGLVVQQRTPLLLTQRMLKYRAAQEGIWGPVPKIWLGVPLVVREEVIGVIAVQSYTSEETYSHEDLELLAAISHQIAIAIDRRRSIEDLQRSEQRINFALQATSSGIWDWDIEHGQIHFDANHYLLAGYRPHEYQATPEEWQRRVHPDDLSQAREGLDQAAAGKTKEYRSEYRYRHKNGNWIWILSKGKVVAHGSDGQPTRLIGTHSDITRPKLAEQKLRQSERTYRNIYLNAQIGLFRLSLPDFRILECNESFARMLGYQGRRQCLAQFHILHAFASKLAMREVLRRIRQHGEVRGNVSPMLTVQGNVVWLRTTARAFADERYVEGVVEDITEVTRAQEEKRALERKLERSKKMEALGLLAGSVAHDLNNILSGIVGYPELILRGLPPDDRLVRPLEAIRDSGKRAALVVSDLLTIARSTASVKEVKCLNQLVKNYLDSPEGQLQTSPSLLTIDLHLDAQVSNICCSPIQVSKSLMNLVTNAIEAVHAKGVIGITTTNHCRQLLKNGQPISTVALSVSDRGQGIRPADLPHIFEPFYTRKIMGKSGTGLGLTVVWNTMEDHGGEVTVTSDRNLGTIFTLFFPTTDQPAEETIDDHDLSQFEGHGERVLIVDDEPQLRDIASQALTAQGYICHQASSGEEAIRFLSGQRVDLVILDMIMHPGLNGRQTYQEILKLHPGQRALLASGYSESKEVEEALRLGAGALLKKPYTLSQLCQAVYEQLA